MHGKNTFKKTLQRSRRVDSKNHNRTSSYLKLGSWRFEEDENGDLAIYNVETNQSVILIRREGSEDA
jgi:hypothetical protein